MAAFLNFNFLDENKSICFHVGDKPTEKYLGIKNTSNVINGKCVIESIQLNGHELTHAIENLGAPPVNKRVVIYFGDEAKRIFFNW